LILIAKAMTRAQLAALSAFLAIEVAALLALATLRSPANVIAFPIIAIAGCYAGSAVFGVLASPDERRKDLEDRVRNPPP
jgi:hypothetical protein